MATVQIPVGGYNARMDINLNQLIELAGRRDYFALLGVKRTYQIDVGELKRNYLRLSRQVHPDFYASDPQNLPRVLALSAALNEAYRTLEDSVRRAEYLLRESGISSEESNVRVAPDFLAQVMEWQETAEAARANADHAALAQVKTELQTHQTALLAQIVQLAELLETNPSSENAQKLRQAISAMGFIRNLRAKVGSSAAG